MGCVGYLKNRDGILSDSTYSLLRSIQHDGVLQKYSHTALASLSKILRFGTKALCYPCFPFMYLKYSFYLSIIDIFTNLASWKYLNVFFETSSQRNIVSFLWGQIYSNTYLCNKKSTSNIFLCEICLMILS